MSNNDETGVRKLKIKDGEITQKLVEIRRRVGGEFTNVAFPETYERKLNYDVERLEDLRLVFHPSELLAVGDKPVFVYIRDHTNRSERAGDPLDDPEAANKLHFSVCRTLREMKDRGKFPRYRVTDDTTGKYPIDVDGKRGKAEMHIAPLLPCKNCLEELAYAGYNKNFSKGEKKEAVNNFVVSEAAEVLQERLDVFREMVTSLKSADFSTWYPDNWRKISRAFKKLHQHRCAGCPVDLSSHPECLDVHHRDSDKPNVQGENLICLCKICHAKKHPHYRKLIGKCQAIIERLRREQGLA